MLTNESENDVESRTTIEKAGGERAECGDSFRVCTRTKESWWDPTYSINNISPRLDVIIDDNK